MADDASAEWWRPGPGSKWSYRLPFIADALGIGTTSFALAALTWTLASTDDGRIKALLWWCIGVTAAGAFVVFRMVKREHKDSRYGRALSSLHSSHHALRDAAYARYIAQADEATWHGPVEDSLREFAVAFTIATGAPCHATIKRVTGRRTSAAVVASELEIKTLFRSAKRSVALRPGIPKNTVGLNSDFRHLFESERDNRCWYQNDLLTLALYENPHWPEERTPKTAPYRSTMVWPIRKVLREGTSVRNHELYIWGFLTIDSLEPGILEYERHFHLGAGYADHLLSVLWDSLEMREVYKALDAGNG